MRITRDENACESHGQCVNAAPDLFELEDGADIVTVKVPEPAADRVAAAKNAISMCPVGALALVE